MCAPNVVGTSMESARIELPTVTLVAATGVAIKETVAAMRQSCRGLSFAEAILFTHENPSIEPVDGIAWRRIEPLRSRADYSHFMLRELVSHIKTDHVLCVQWDGFVIRPAAWSAQFLDYDYIGARWPQFADCTVGNGGFSLRSKRLLEAARKIELDQSEAEDLAICRRYRPTLEKSGIRFATPDVADAFSYERTEPSGREFGFHGIFNFRPLIGSQSLRNFLSTLDSGLVGRREWRDLFRQSLRDLDLPLANQLLRYKSQRTLSS